MRALEFYIDIVYILTTSFYHLRHLSFFPVYRPQAKQPALVSRADTFESFEKPEAMIEALPMPPPQTIPSLIRPAPPQDNLMEIIEQRYWTEQTVPQTIDRDSARSAQLQNSNQHQSMAARLSTWLLNERSVQRPAQEQAQSWDVDPERGPSPTAQGWGEQARPESEVLRPVPALDDDERRGVFPFPSYTLAPPIEDEETTSMAGTALVPPSSTGAIEDADVESQKTPIPDREWQGVEFLNAARHSGVGADALEQENYKLGRDEPEEQQGHAEPIPEHAEFEQGRTVPEAEDSPIASDIQVVIPPSEEGSRPNSTASAQYATSPYPASPAASAAPSLYPSSPLASAAATPVPRSRPLPPMPDRRPSSMLNSVPPSPSPDSARSSNISMLLRRQNELDKSIAALKLFSPSPDSESEEQSRSLTPDSLPDITERLSPAPSAATNGFTLESADVPLNTPRTVLIPDTSAQSEFYFDSQPPLNRSSMDSGVIPAALESVPYPEEPLPERSANMLALPQPPGSRWSESSSLRDRRVDSMGTQYDITSFVGSTYNFPDTFFCLR